MRLSVHIKIRKMHAEQQFFNLHVPMFFLFAVSASSTLSEGWASFTIKTTILHRSCAEEWRLCVFLGSCAITFPRAALNEHGPGRPSARTVRRAPSTRLAPAVFLASTPERSVSFGTPCLSPAATKQTKERRLRRKTCFPPKPAPCSRPSPCPVPVSCSGSVSHSAPQLCRGPGPKRSAVQNASRPPRRRQASHECAEHWALNRSHPRSPASRMQIRTGRSSPASALSGATRSAQSRTPASLAARHRPHPMSIPGRPL